MSMLVSFVLLWILVGLSVAFALNVAVLVLLLLTDDEEDFRLRLGLIRTGFEEIPPRLYAVVYHARSFGGALGSALLGELWGLTFIFALAWPWLVYPLGDATAAAFQVGDD